jgi:hypothetical protein
MDLELLQQADFCLSKCGKPVAPPGLSVLYIPRGVPIQIQAAATAQQTIAREVTGETDWELRAISMSISSTVSLYLQIQLPDGTFLFNQLLDISQVAGFGSARYVFSKPHLCPPGTRFIVTFDTTITSAATTQPVMVLFEGCDRYLFKNGQPAKCPEAFAARLPRIFGEGNENILAPCWQQGFTPEPPRGYKFVPYTPVSVPYGQSGNVRITGQPPFVSVAAVAGPFTATAAIQIDQTNDFEVQRFLFDVQADATITAGTFLCRIRNSSGYSFCDDYFDVQQYIGSSPFAKRWRVMAGDTIYFDLNVVDGAGSGNMYFRAFAEGLRRIRG